MEKLIPILTSPPVGVLLFVLLFTQWVVGQGVTSIVSWWVRFLESGIDFIARHGVRVHGEEGGGERDGAVGQVVD